MRGDVANERVGQRLLVVLPVIFFLPSFTTATGLIVPSPLLICCLSVAILPCFGVGFVILGAYETAFDPDGAIMIEDHERADARDIPGHADVVVSGGCEKGPHHHHASARPRRWRTVECMTESDSQKEQNRIRTEIGRPLHDRAAGRLLIRPPQNRIVLIA